jgi:hypothetical protein
MTKRDRIHSQQGSEAVNERPARTQRGAMLKPNDLPIIEEPAADDESSAKSVCNSFANRV